MTARRSAKKRPAPAGRKAKPAAKAPARSKAKTPAKTAAPVPAPRLPATDNPDVYRLVCVGASAGGLEALSELLEHLPPDTGLSLVLVQHLDPSHASILTELLARKTTMAVLEAKDHTQPAPNHVYIIPPNARLALEGGRLRVRPRGLERQLPIDEFFKSAAADLDGHTLGVLLSGTGSDGTQGLLAIKAAGGITLAQEPRSAKYPGMIDSAVAAGAVDRLLPPAQLAVELARLSGAPWQPPPAALEPPETLPPESAGLLAEVLRRVAVVTGTDLSGYKEAPLLRRIHRRALLTQSPDLAHYLQRLRGQTAEVKALFNDFLINVTEFFRDPEVYAALIDDYFPALLLDHPPERPLRVWVPGCATGQEVYSLAIALLEAGQKLGQPSAIQLFGTDLSETAIQHARAARYPPSIANNVSADRLGQFFIEAPGGYRVNKAVRDLCIFSRHNLLADPPFFRLDLVSCRNLLIYLKPSTQALLGPLFHYALNPGGLLVVGKSEGATGDGLFKVVSKKDRVFARADNVRHAPLEMPAAGLRRSLPPPLEIAMPRTPPAGGPPHVSWADADRLVLAKYGPPGVVVDQTGEIIQFRGRTAGYFEHPPGQASLNLLKLAHSELRLPLRALFERAQQDNVAARQEGLTLKLPDQTVQLNLEVIPFTPAVNSHDTIYLVLIEERPAEPAGQARGSKAPAGQARGSKAPAGQARGSKAPAGQARGSKAPAAPEANERIAQLERELVTTREHLQAVIETQDNGNEELRTLVEELQSTNEELQSTNEELQTTKEELQSTNEELTTLNEELQTRNAEVTQANSNLDNLLVNVHVPILMVGGDLRVRLFTPGVTSVLRIVPTDIGRPLGEIRPRLVPPDWEQLVLTVIQTQQPLLREVQDETGQWYAMRIRPYYTIDKQPDGAVVVWVEIEQSQGRLRALTGYLTQVREEERTHMAREIHDGLAQELAGLKMDLTRWLKLGQREPQTVAQMAPDMLARVDSILDKARDLSRELRPAMLDELGLLVAIEWLLQDNLRRRGLRYTFAPRPESLPLSGETATGVFRILQEALVNVTAHARASRVDVGLELVDHQLVMRVADNGRGITKEELANANSLGLMGMRERAMLMRGLLDIDGEPGHGTTLTLTVPLPKGG